VPRPQSNRGNEVAQENFKKKLLEIIKVMIKYFGKGKPVRIWCEDESRFGLITMQGRMITLKGVKPLGKKQWKRGNFYVYSELVLAAIQEVALQNPKLDDALRDRLFL
jgi:hypothetical protein